MISCLFIEDLLLREPARLADQGGTTTKSLPLLSSVQLNMSSHQEWWLQNNSLTPRGVVPIGGSPRSWQMQQQRGPAVSGDLASSEIFLGSRRGHGLAMPNQNTSPFGREEGMLTNQQKPYHMMSPLQQRYAMKMAPSEQSVSYVSTNRPSRQTALRDTSWQRGDSAPFALDMSPRGAHPMPVSHVARDPDLVGYKSQGSAGYGAEMLFGTKPPERPALEAQVAEWRATRTTNDSNPFTFDGSVPAPSPRRDPGRKLQKELMAQFAVDDTMAREAARGEMQRYERFVARNGGVDPNVVPGIDLGFCVPSMVSSGPTDASSSVVDSGKSSGNWRSGDSHPLTLDGSIVAPRTRSSTIDSTWRKFDTNGIAQFDRASGGFQGDINESIPDNYSEYSPSQFRGQGHYMRQPLQFERHQTPAMSRFLPGIVNESSGGGMTPQHQYYGSPSPQGYHRQ